MWKARDTRLGRDVAIKVSKEQYTERFTREARAIAALNHPNLCHLYDVGPNYILLEHVEGAMLKGPIRSPYAGCGAYTAIPERHVRARSSSVH